jgi:uncharacterized membrane protein
MAVSEFSKLAGIGGGLIMNIVKGIGVLVFAIALFYAIKWFQKRSKKQKAFTINADILDMNGVLEFDRMAFVKGDETGLMEMNFETRKMDSMPPIPKHLIKAGHCLLLNYAPGHYAVIDTAKTLHNFENGLNKIEIVNLGMKKYLMSKQREIMNKTEDKKRKWEAYAPWVTLTITIVAAVLLCALLFYLGYKFDAMNMAARIEECKSAGWV